MRFDRLLSVVEAATPTAFAAPAPDGYNWYRPWAIWLLELRKQAVDEMASPSRQLASQVARPLEEQLSAASARLDAWLDQCAERFDVAADAAFPSALPDGDLPASFHEISESDRWIHCITDGAVDRLTAEYPASAGSSRQVQVFGLLAVASLSIAALLLLSRPEIRDFFYKWPQAVGFLIGMAYWAWMEPSWLGLLMATACVVLACRSGWPGRAIRLDASTVLRAGRSE
jgi:hypothetical protein